jgi:hypothetical protein
MSVLETPRILFKGEISWDPIVTNNYPKFYDENTGEPVWQSVADKVKEFRRAAIDAVTTGGNWNPHGTHRARFYDTAISGVDLGAGVASNDPFVASAANFVGMLVDLEPYGAFSSQLFFDTMQFGIDGGYRILCKRSTRATARYINFARNPANAMIAGVASVIWQTSFAKADGLCVDAFGSPALLALEAALQSDDVIGLTVRLNTYRTVYYDNLALTNKSPLTKQASEALTAKLLAGGFQPNPARSVLVGVVGLWRKGEPLHEPGERALLPTSTSTLGSAHARLAAQSLTIDLSNSVPEDSKDLTKSNLGTLSVVAVDASGKSTALGSLPYSQYDKQAYESSSGIVSLPLTSQQVAAASDQDVQVLASDGTVLLAEQALRVIPMASNVYLDEGSTATAAFQVHRRGAPAVGKLPVTVYTMSADGDSIEKTSTLQTDAEGRLTIPVTGTAGGVFAYVPSAAPDELPPSQGINPQLNTYMYIRTWPADANIAALPPTWDNVYTQVLANWNAMAPCMDNWLRLDDPAQVLAYGNLLKRLTDPAAFESFLFMPVTRDMSAGERTLLYKFLDQPPGAKMKLAAVPDDKDRFAHKSRAMRRPDL